MLPPELLSDPELVAVTQYRARARQCAALDAMGVPYIRRRDGMPLVRRDDLRGQAGGWAPNLGVLDRARRKAA